MSKRCAYHQGPGHETDMCYTLSHAIQDLIDTKRCAYHQGPGHDTDTCYTLSHAIQDLIDTKVIAPPTRPSITNNPLSSHNFGRGPRINFLMSEEEKEEDPSKLIYDLSECFMMTREELMGMTSAARYDI